MSTHYDFPSRKREAIKILAFTEGPSMTVQSHKDETDINKIVARFHRTGEMPPSTKTPQYADISSIQQLDATTALETARDTISQVKTDLHQHTQKLKEQQQQQEHDALVEKIKKDLQTPPPEPKPAP